MTEITGELIDHWGGPVETKKQKVLVLGGSGMLGNMVYRVLAGLPGLEVHVTTRDPECEGQGPWRWFDVVDFLDDKSPETLLCSGYSWVVNCIGVTRPMINEFDRHSIDRAILINSQFPYLLAEAAERHQFRIIQVATDCVFSGKEGRYTESSSHDAIDVYGKTKSLGEVISPNVMHLRCSVIGPEPRPEKRFLLEWVLKQEKNAKVPGFMGHWWNGVTTHAFAKVCGAIIGDDSLFSPGVHHIVPHGCQTKAVLLDIIRCAFDREDLEITPTMAGTPCDRTLATIHPTSKRLWEAAGYAEPPFIAAMLQEMAAFEKVSHGQTA